MNPNDGRRQAGETLIRPQKIDFHCLRSQFTNYRLVRLPSGISRETEEAAGAPVENGKLEGEIDEGGYKIYWSVMSRFSLTSL